jgi:hypothetical protein
VAFLCRKPGLTRSEFIDYHEKQHIPRILDLERQPAGHRRTDPIPHDADTAARVGTDAGVRADERPTRRISWTARAPAPIPSSSTSAADEKATDLLRT